MKINMRGFTLIELMIVVVIVGIFAAIALPQYSQYVMRGKRGEGITAIHTVLEAQERYYADHLRYTADLSDLGLPNPYTSPQGFYQLTAADSCGGLARCVQVTATALGGQADDGNLVANTKGKKVRVKGGNELDW